MVGNDLEVDPRRSGLKVFVFFCLFFCRDGRVGRALLFTQFHIDAQMQPSKRRAGQVEEAEGEAHTPPSIHRKEVIYSSPNTNEKLQKSTLRYKSVEN